MSRWSCIPLILSLSFFVFGCSRECQRCAVPEHLVKEAEPVGFKDVRYFAQAGESPVSEELMESFVLENKDLITMGQDGRGHYSALVMSGGGSNGAYTAGFLKGWTESGTRPKFKVVTGVSAGAVMATFAFLGSEYDEDLERIYTNLTSDDVYRERGILFALRGSSLNSLEPFKCLIDRYVTAEILEKVAAEYRRGRQIYMGTTNLDTQQFTVWNMGKIALEGTPEALELYKQVIVASSSLPVFFPPMYIRVEAEGKTYEEMHIDGAATSHVFFPYGTFDCCKAVLEEGGIEPLGAGVKLYVIRNGNFRGVWYPTEDKLMTIAMRAVDNVATYHGIGDTYKLWDFCVNNDVDFNLAHIPLSYPIKQNKVFDPNEMKRLFDLGRNEARYGYKWAKEPPHFRP